jgi:hypothetical protein
MKISRSLPALLLALLLPASAAAQAISARVVEGGSGKPVVGALLSLLDGSGKQVAAGLSDAEGRVLLRAWAPGNYRVRSEEVGFSSAVSAPIPLALGQTVEWKLTISPMPVQLEGIVARAGPRCVTRRGGNQGVDVVWEEARKALNATAWTEALNLITFEARRFERDLDPSTLNVQREFFRDFTRTGGPAYQSRPASELADHGYVRRDGDGWVYFAPDARVLLSDQFLDTHCFRLENGVGENAGRIGLAFQPVRNGKLPDIDGVLWLDPASAELKYLEFRYVRLPDGYGRRDAGGRVDFRRLPSGAWFVDHWRIRAQLAELHQRQWRGRFTTVLESTLIREFGGEVTSVTERDAPPPRAAKGVIEGRVVHAPREPLPDGVRAYISGTSYRADADSTGSFRITGLPAGSYTVTLTDPDLAVLGFPAPRATVSLADGATVLVRLEYPSAADLFASACADDVSRMDRVAAVFGVVRDSAGGVVAERPLRIRWLGEKGHRDFARSGDRVTTTDGQGRFRICGLPAERELTTETQEGRRWRAADRFSLHTTGLIRRDFVLAAYRGELKR